MGRSAPANSPVIVSLTTIRARLEYLPAVVNSILDQTIRPDQVVVAISESPYMLDEGIPEDLAKASLASLRRKGDIEVVVTDNTGPYRKLLPVLSRHEGHDCLIVTADDDMIYPPDWLDGLLYTHQHTGEIAAYRCRAMAVRGGEFTPYSSWHLLSDPRCSYEDAPAGMHALLTLGTGVRGILYHPRFFPNLSLLDRLRLAAPRQDDLAFKAATMCAGIGVTQVLEEGSFSRRFRRTAEETDSLFDENKRQNNAAWRRILQILKEETLFDLSTALRENSRA